MRKHYNTKETLKTTFMIIMILVDIALGIAVWKQESDARREAWENSYPMANRYVEWTGAGYQNNQGVSP